MVGRIVYIGEVHYAAGTFIGLIVLGGGGKNNGTFTYSKLFPPIAVHLKLALRHHTVGMVRGTQYFSCPPNKGLLIRADEIRSLDTSGPLDLFA